MPSALVLQHLPQEGPGVFVDALARAGWAVAIRDTPLVGVDPAHGLAADLLIVMGGPCGAYETQVYPWLGDTIALLRDRIAQDRPLLGVCLGAQLIATALGCAVFRGPAPEIGWHPVALTDAGRASPLRHLDGVPILHWHSDTFDLPAGAQLLATTPAYHHQAFSRGPRLLALQCHPEHDGRDFEHWLLGQDRALARHGLTVPRLREAARAHGPAAGRAGAALLGEWLGGL
jgi:GMP synthase (glutamine-hydrolysing)